MFVLYVRSDPELCSSPHSIHFACELSSELGRVNHQQDFIIGVGNSEAAIILRGLPNRKYLSHSRWHVVDKCDCGGYILSKYLLVCPVSVLHLILDRFR